MLSRKALSRRDFLRMSTVTAAGLAVAACAAPVAPAAPAAPESEVQPTAAAAAVGKVHITLSSWWNKSFKDYLSKFNEKEPNIEVELIDEEFQAHHEKLVASLVAGSGAADIVGIEDSRVPLMADTGGLADLSELMLPYMDKLVPYKLALATYNGKVMAVPWDGSPAVLFYRTDIMEEHNIDPTKFETYDDYLAAGQQLLKDSDGKIKFYNQGKDATFPVLQMTWQQGGGIYSADGTKVIINSPEAVRALTFVKTLWDTGLVHQNLSADAANATWKDGTSAIFPGAIWYGNQIKGVAPETSGKWHIVRVPAWDKGGSRAFTQGGSTLAIPAQGKHIAEAFKYLEFTQLTQEGNEFAWTDGDLFPVLKDASNWSILNQPVEFYGGQSALKLFAEVNADVKPYMFGKGYLEADRIIGLQIAECLDGRKTPQEALDAAAQEIRDKQKLA